MALSYACFRSGNEDQCFGLVVLAPKPDGRSGRLVHFDPFQIGTYSTQFLNCLSSAGMPAKFGGRYLGSACCPVRTSLGFAVASITSEPNSPVAPPIGAVRAVPAGPVLIISS